MNLVTRTFLLSITLLFAVAGCNTMEGAGQDIEAAGEGIERESRENRSY